MQISRRNSWQLNLINVMLIAVFAIVISICFSIAGGSNNAFASDGKTTLSFDNIRSIKFIPSGNNSTDRFVLHEGLDAHLEEGWDDDDNYYEYDHYIFPTAGFLEGDKIEITFEDGTKTTITSVSDYRSVWIDKNGDYVNEYINDTGYYVHVPWLTPEIVDNQRYDNIWKVGKNKTYVEFNNIRYEIEVTVKENPVKKITYTPSKAVELSQLESYDYDLYDWETDEDFTVYGYYYLPFEGDKLTLTTASGIENYYAKHNYKIGNETYYLAFVDNNGKVAKNAKGEIFARKNLVVYLKTGETTCSLSCELEGNKIKPGNYTFESIDGDFYGFFGVPLEASITVIADKPKPKKTDNQKGVDGTAVGKGASSAVAEKAITSAKNDNDPKGSVFGDLQLKSSKQTKTAITLKWKKVKGANKYVVYGNACGAKNKMKKLKTLSKTSFKVTKISKKLKKGTYHKFIVVALDKNNKVVSTSKVIHVATKGGKVGNNKAVKTKAKKNKITLKKGKVFKLAGKTVPASKLTVKKHTGVRYETSNKKIASVSKKGVVKGLKKGSCKIYVYAQDGTSATIKVTVK